MSLVRGLRGLQPAITTCPGVDPFGSVHRAKEAALRNHYKSLNSAPSKILDARSRRLSVTGFCFHDLGEEDPSALRIKGDFKAV